MKVLPLDCLSQVKSYLAGNPAICLALNDNLAIGRRGGAHGNDFSYGTTGQDAVMLDDCNFHESVSLDRFDTERTLELVPPDGEFAVMNYRFGLWICPPYCPLGGGIHPLQGLCGQEDHLGPAHIIASRPLQAWRSLLDLHHIGKKASCVASCQLVGPNADGICSKPAAQMSI